MRRYLYFVLGIIALAALPLLASGAPNAEANNAWGPYHWARTANPFTLKLGDNLSSTWDPILATTSSDWSVSTVLNTTVDAGGAGDPRKCRATTGRVEVCNAKYGARGWLGLASIWISGGHITKGAVKLNDTYFNTAKYDTPAWRNLVSCQEVGHTLGLDHQDENFNNPNLGTCMDYTSSPDSNQHPNAHDYAMLEAIYAHLDSTTTVDAGAPSGPGRNRGARVDEPGDDPADWGRPVGVDGHGRVNQFELDLGNGQKKLTHVLWTR